MQVKIEVTFKNKETCFIILNIPEKALTISKVLLSDKELLIYCIIEYIDIWVNTYLNNVESWTEVEIIKD